MKRKILSLILTLGILVTPQMGSATGIPVVDVTAIANLVTQINHMMTMIKQLKDLQKWAEIDHTNLASKKFAKFLGKYRDQFDRIQKEITDYQDGGLLGQIGRLDDVYYSYYDSWEKDDKEGDFTVEASPNHRAIKKQILWTRIQLKHAAKVAAKIRDAIPEQEEEIQTLLADTAQAVGLMQSVKIGNEISGMMAKSLQTLNVQLAEVIQEKAASGLEKNHKDGLQKNRQRQALEGFATRADVPKIAPLNPIGGF